MANSVSDRLREPAKLDGEWRSTETEPPPMYALVLTIARHPQPIHYMSGYRREHLHDVFVCDDRMWRADWWMPLPQEIANESA